MKRLWFWFTHPWLSDGCWYWISAALLAMAIVIPTVVFLKHFLPNLNWR